MGLFAAAPTQFTGAKKMRADAIQGAFASKKDGLLGNPMVLSGAGILIVMLIGILILGRLKKPKS